MGVADDAGSCGNRGETQNGYCCPGDRVGLEEGLASQCLPEHSSGHGSPCGGEEYDDAGAGSDTESMSPCDGEIDSDKRNDLQCVHSDEVGDAQVAVAVERAPHQGVERRVAKAAPPVAIDDARSRSRTGTVSHWCLRPARLPIPPSGHIRLG